MATELQQQIGSLDHGDHACLIYETAEEQLAAAIPFLRDGLRKNEHCIYVADDRTSQEVLHALHAAGIDGDAEIERGALQVGTKRESYLRDGSFDPGAMIDFLRSAAEDAVERGFDGLRITGEMTWALGEEMGCDRVVEYEALLNEYFPGSASLAICQYNRRRFSADVIHDVLRTHPVAIIRGQVCPNLYYEPPRMVLGGESMPSRVSWMIGQLMRARTTARALEEVSEAKSNFMAAMSHELRTPLNAIIGYTSLLRTEVTGPLTQKQRQQLERIEENTRQLLQIVEEILTFSRIEAQREKVHLDWVDIGKIVREVAALLEPIAAARGLRLEIAPMPMLAPTHTDAGKVRQILVNLLSNAVNFTEQGGISVDVKEREREVLITITDSGIGIAPEDQETIFDPFRQLDAGATRRVGGTGIGLTVGRQLSRLLGGDLTVQSEPGVGSVFTLRIPSLPQTRVSIATQAHA